MCDHSCVTIEYRLHNDRDLDCIGDVFGCRYRVILPYKQNGRGTNGMTVLAAPLLRIRIVGDHVLAVYLNWFINQPTAQAYLASHARGTSVSMINKQALEEMEIAVPPLERQKKIVELAELTATEQQLLRRLAEKRNWYMKRLLMQLALD